MELRSIAALTDAELRGKRALVRVGFDVPIDNGAVANDFRIRQALPTITHLAERGAKVVLISHIGREGDTLAPVYAALRTSLPDVVWVPKTTGADTEAAVAALPEGGVALLENLRMDAREEANDPTFAEALARLGDLYVNDAFSNSHREHASMVGVTAHLPAYAGLALMREVGELEKAFVPQPPSLCILGGAKFDTKLPLVEKFLPLYDKLFVGGALAHDVWRARGISVGASKTSEADLSGSAVAQDARIMLPIDVVVATEGGEQRVTTPGDVHDDEHIYDCGPETIAALREVTKTAKTILWNGTLGWCEGGYEEGTDAVADAVAKAPGFSIVGGGDTVAALEEHGFRDDTGFISSGGGAMLAFLEKGTLPALEVLKQ